MKGRERGTKMAREKEKGSQVVLSPPPLPAWGIPFCSLAPPPRGEVGLSESLPEAPSSG